MQDLIKYNGYSIFCYLTPIEYESWKANLIIQDLGSENPPEKSIQLPDVFIQKEMAIYRAKEYGKKLIDERAKQELKDEVDTEINPDKP